MFLFFPPDIFMSQLSPSLMTRDNNQTLYSCWIFIGFYLLELS